MASDEYTRTYPCCQCCLDEGTCSGNLVDFHEGPCPDGCEAYDAKIEYCLECRLIVGVGCACGLTFAEKMKSVQINNLPGNMHPGRESECTVPGCGPDAEYRAAWDAWAAAVKADAPREQIKALWAEVNAVLDRIDPALLRVLAAIEALPVEGTGGWETLLRVMAERDAARAEVTSLGERIRTYLDARGRLCGVCLGLSPSWDGHDKNPPCETQARDDLRAALSPAPTPGEAATDG